VDAAGTADGLRGQRVAGVRDPPAVPQGPRQRLGGLARVPLRLPPRGRRGRRHGSAVHPQRQPTGPAGRGARPG
ncbi:MAG: Dihydrolipoamide succinyltransferase component (E2) of 2-oxoglutarate dehydrogenase complex / 2-oxoglutarate dehydrogenase E1 component @ 2-oxoglutarate decarboxylase @ 2-hydroxy-3-oxoadipate synthase, partial [uncultured Frankineae bacterium]